MTTEEREDGLDPKIVEHLEAQLDRDGIPHEISDPIAR